MPIDLEELPKDVTSLVSPLSQRPRGTFVASGTSGANLAFQVIVRRNSRPIIPFCNSCIYLTSPEIDMDKILEGEIPIEFERERRFPLKGVLEFSKRAPEALYQLLKQQGLEMNVTRVYGGGVAPDIIRKEGIIAIKYGAVRNYYHEQVEEFLSAFHQRHK